MAHGWERNYKLPKLTIGTLAAAWMNSHCVIPNDEHAGEPWRCTADQTVYLCNYYAVKPTAKVGQKATAFVYRTGMWMAAQKVGKSPGIAAQICFEFVGPALFDGFAKAGETYSCRKDSKYCDCDFVYRYGKGEPKGKPWATPRIQVCAVAEDQVENTWSALVGMIELGPLAKVFKLRGGKVGEEFVRHPNANRDSRIEIVTSKANTRLGARITAAFCDEIGLWTDSNKMRVFWRTLARGLAGMGGRACASTNCYDPSQESQAQTLHETKLKDVYCHYFPPNPEWDFKKKSDRLKIIEFNYELSPWVDIEGIMAEAEGAMEVDPAEAERFFGNRVVAGSGSWLQLGQWEKRQKASVQVAFRTKVCAGFDGSENNDWSGIRLETLDFHQFTPKYLDNTRDTIWIPGDWGGRIPRGEVHRAWEDIARNYEIVRAYCDPYKFETELDVWKSLYGDTVFFAWATNATNAMWAALERMKTDIVEDDTEFTHDACKTTGIHFGNAVKKAQQGQKYIIQKASEPQKIDLAMSSVLCHEAACDAVAAGANNVDDEYAYVM